jgi:hypothetical protein
MEHRKMDESSVRHDAAVAAAQVIMEEFCPHCPNGMGQAIHERLCEIIETAIESAGAIRWRIKNEPSEN